MITLNENMFFDCKGGGGGGKGWGSATGGKNDWEFPRPKKKDQFALKKVS